MTVRRKMLTPVRQHAMQMAMVEMPVSLDTLCKVSGLAKPTVTRFVRQLQAANLVHRGGWFADARGYPTIELYKFGAGANAPCPVKNETSTVRMAAIRAKKKEQSA